MDSRVDAYKNVPGHLWESDARVLQDLASNLDVFEIGTHHGRSAVALAGTANSVDTLDTYRGDKQIGAPDKAQTLRYIAESGLGALIAVYEGDGVGYLYSHDMSRYGFIFWDASHIPPVYEHHFLEWVIESGYRGIVAVHDYKTWDPDMSYVVQAVDEFEKKTGRKRCGPLADSSVVWFEALD